MSPQAALEETFFLGLRLNQGVDLHEVARQFGTEMALSCSNAVIELVRDGLLHREADVVRLTPRGRLLSNEVFSKFIATPALATPGLATPTMGAPS